MNPLVLAIGPTLISEIGQGIRQYLEHKKQQTTPRQSLPTYEEAKRQGMPIPEVTQCPPGIAEGAWWMSGKPFIRLRQGNGE